MSDPEKTPSDNDQTPPTEPPKDYKALYEAALKDVEKATKERDEALTLATIRPPTEPPKLDRLMKNLVGKYD